MERLNVFSTSTAEKKLFFRKVYEQHLAGTRANIPKIMSALRNNLSEEFDPRKLPPDIFNYSPPLLQLGGLFSIFPREQVLTNCNNILKAIKQKVVDSPEDKQILIEPIAKMTAISPAEVCIYLEAVKPYGDFWRGASYDAAESVIMRTIDVGSSENVYYEYLYFRSIEIQIAKREEKIAKEWQEDTTSFESDDRSMQEERLMSFTIIFQAFDDLQQGMAREMEARGQFNKEIIDKLNIELEDLKQQFFKLNNKNFWQLAKGKLGNIALNKLCENATINFLYHKAIDVVLFIQQHL